MATPQNPIDLSKFAIDCDRHQSAQPISKADDRAIDKADSKTISQSAIDKAITRF
jgi:hypothetical protein